MIREVARLEDVMSPERLVIAESISDFMLTSGDDLFLASEIADALGMKIKAVGYYLGRLRAAGVVGKKHSRCKLCGKGVSVLWGLLETKEERAASMAALRAAAEARARVRVQEIADRREARRERVAADRRWREEHPEAAAERARIAKRSSDAVRRKAQFIERVDPVVVWDRDEGICGICGEQADRETWQIDHIVPLSRGGEHSYRNVQVAHPSCNARKGSKSMARLAREAPSA